MLVPDEGQGMHGLIVPNLVYLFPISLITENRMERKFKITWKMGFYRGVLWDS